MTGGAGASMGKMGKGALQVPGHRWVEGPPETWRCQPRILIAKNQEGRADRGKVKAKPSKQ